MSYPSQARCCTSFSLIFSTVFLVTLSLCFTSRVDARTSYLSKSHVDQVHKLNPEYYDSSSFSSSLELESNARFNSNSQSIGELESNSYSDSDSDSDSVTEEQQSQVPDSKFSLSLQDLEDKLVMILDTEDREKKLLENLVAQKTKENSEIVSKATTATTHRHHYRHHPDSDLDSEPESGKIQSRRRKSAHPPHGHTNANENGNENEKEFVKENESAGEKDAVKTTTTRKPKPLTKTSDFNLESEAELESGAEELNSQDGDDNDRRRGRGNPTQKEDEEEKGKAKDPSAIAAKLEENSKRMETMVIFLADLRNVLSEAVSSQEKQVALRGEVVELREEIDYLRKEVQKLRSEQAMQTTNMRDPKLDNKIHNDETTIEWLKENVKELRHGLEEVSSSVNVTGLVNLRLQWETEVNRVNGDLKSLRRDIEDGKVSQARHDEALLEIRGEIADLRTWHIKMGKKLLEETQEQVIHNESNKEKSWPWLSGVGGGRRRKVAIAGSDSPRKSPSFNLLLNTKGESRRSRHQRKLKSELTSLETVIRDVVRDQTLLHRRIVKLEKKLSARDFVLPSPSSSSLRLQRKEQQERRLSMKSRLENDDKEDEEDDAEIELEEEKEDAKLVSFLSSNDVHNDGDRASGNDKNNNNNNNYNNYYNKSKKQGNSKIMEYGASNSYRLSNLEKVVSDYEMNLENVKQKVTSLNGLRESSTQLFSALEALESKYDERLTEMQTGLSKIEAALSTTSITNEELKEQQNLQSKIVQTLKKDFLATKGQVQTNHLRLAAVQSQFLKWGLKSCMDK